MNLELTGKSALVLSASAGLGKACAERLAAEGANTVICSSNLERITRTADEIGAQAIACDLSDTKNMESLITKCNKIIGTPDIIVINSKGPYTDTFMNTSLETWQDEFNSLWLVPIALLRHFLPKMQKRRYGRIVWITSVLAQESAPAMTTSNSLRPGLHGLIKSISDEYAAYDITVNAVMPGFINTERLKHISAEHMRDVKIPMQRFGKPEEVGALVAFLASSGASYISGQMIACDGGWLRGC